MKIQPVLIVVTLVNVAAMMVTLTTMHPAAAAEAVAPVLRGRALEILDGQGKVRASISVLPATTSAHGDRSPETVLMRLITERGRPSVKISASEEAAGVSLAGPSGTKDTYVILDAKGTASSLRLRNEDGREQIVKP